MSLGWGTDNSIDIYFLPRISVTTEAPDIIAFGAVLYSESVSFDCYCRYFSTTLRTLIAAGSLLGGSSNSTPSRDLRGFIDCPTSPVFPRQPWSHSKKSAALAPFTSHRSPTLDTPSPKSLSYPSSDFKISTKLSHRSRFSATHLISFTVLLVVLAVQLLKPSPSIHGWHSRSRGPQQSPPAFCENSDIFSQPPPISRPHKMSLIEEAKKVAVEFEYPGAEVNKGVKEFIRQMGKYYPLASSSNNMS